MRVLTLNTYDGKGGAARAAYRLHQELTAQGLDTRMFVQKKTGNDPSVISPDTLLDKVKERIRVNMDSLPLRFYPKRNGTVWGASWIPHWISSRIREFSPDIVHLHWITDGFIPVQEIARIDRPIIWTLHDMWPFTGGCHTAGGCTRYETWCGSCPQLGSSRQYDLTSWILRRKWRHWNHSSLTFVAPSHWLGTCAQKSGLLSRHRIVVIPNGVDTNVFKPLPRDFARTALNLPRDRPLIVFGAQNPFSDPNKGFSHLNAAMNYLNKKVSDRPEIVSFGTRPLSEPFDKPWKTHHLGQILSDLHLALIYSAGDLFVAPSINENLPNTVIEALACGSPAVGFDAGGMPDLISHRRNGYLARPYDTCDLAEGILWLLDDKESRADLKERARETAISTFDVRNVARTYMDLYRSVMVG